VATLFSDDFNRSAGPIGSPWETLNGTWEISLGGRLTCTDFGSGSQAVCVVESGASDVLLQSQVIHSGTGADCGLVVRAVDNDNYLLLAINGGGGTAVWYERVGGGFTLIGGWSGGVFSSGALVRVVCLGTSIRVYANGVEATGLALTTSRFQTATKHGVRAYSGSIAFDVFKLTDPGDEPGWDVPIYELDDKLFHLRFDGDLTDSGQLGYHGTDDPEGEVTFTTACPGPGFANSHAGHFDGASFVRIGIIPDYPYPSAGAEAIPASFSFWFKTSAAGPQGIFSQAVAYPDEFPGGNVPAVYIDSTGKLRSSLFWHGSTGHQTQSLSAVNDGEWHHAAAVYDGTFDKLYLDGALVSTVPTSPLSQHAYSGVYYYAVGAARTNGWSNGGSGSCAYFNGDLDDVRFYGKGLTADEVAALAAGEDIDGGTTPPPGDETSHVLKRLLFNSKLLAG